MPGGRCKNEHSFRRHRSQIDEAVNLIYVFIKDDINLQQNMKLEDVFLEFLHSKVRDCLTSVEM